MTEPSRTIVYCKRCKASFPLPEFSDVERDRLASSVPNGQHIQAIQLLRQLAELDLRAGKAVEDFANIHRPSSADAAHDQIPLSGWW